MRRSILQTVGTPSTLSAWKAAIDDWKNKRDDIALTFSQQVCSPVLCYACIRIREATSWCSLRQIASTSAPVLPTGLLMKAYCKFPISFMDQRECSMVLCRMKTGVDRHSYVTTSHIQAAILYFIHSGPSAA